MLNLTVALVCLFVGLAAHPASALHIEDAVARTLERNERADAAEQDALAAAARAGRARALLLPSLTASSAWMRQGEGVSSGTEGQETALALQQTLFSARAFPLLSQAKHGRDAARLQADETRRELGHAAASAFLEALAQEQVALAAARRRQLAQQALTEIRLRFDAQLTGSNDVTRAELEAATADRELVRSDGNARVAHLVLGNLMGGQVADSLEAPAALLTLAETPREWPQPEEVVGSRPDIQAARLRVEALRASALEPMLRWVPDLGLSGSTRATADEGLDAGRDNWILALALRWQLFDGGGREADRAERLALARSAELQLAGLERGVRLEIESARALLESAQASLGRSRVALDAARRNAQESAELYRRGLARALDVLDANVQLFVAEAELVRAQTALSSAYLGYRQAIGLDPFDKESTP